MGAAMGDNMDKMGGGQGQDQWGKGVRRAIDRREIGTSAEIQNTDKADHPYMYWQRQRGLERAADTVRRRRRVPEATRGCGTL